MVPALVSLSLLTFNCLFRPNPANRLATLARELQGRKLDVLCLQEVVWRPHVRLLCEALPGFPHVAFRPFGLAVKGGLVLMSRWPIAHWRYETYRRRGRLTSLGFSDWAIHKGFQVARLETGGGTVVVVNTHLLANYAGDWSPESDYARREWDELQQLARSLAAVDAGMPVVVAGDLNVPAGTWLHRDFLRAARLRDVFDGAREPTGRWKPGPTGPPPAIDHVLVRVPEGWRSHASAGLVFQDQVSLVTGERGHLSDHFGIEAHLEIER
jgi:endonuclease/exonuclease/phosphatase family metal-dependent hydrolase